MLRPEYMRRLVDEAHVELYLSANDGGRIYWPWRMHPPKEATKKYRNACEKYIIDSDPLDDSVTTTDVLDKAYALDAEVCSLQDIYLDKDGTVHSIMQGLEVADDHAFDGQLLLPLQQPYPECFDEIGLHGTDHLVGLGGLKDGTAKERIKTTRELRTHIGTDVWLHGFGWGPKGELARAIRQEPTLLDSLDYSTPVQMADYTTSTPGAERMSVTAAQAGAKLIEDLREVTSHPRELTAGDMRTEDQSGIEQWQ